MSEIIEKRFGSDILRKEKKAPGPKGDVPEDDDLFPPEQAEENRIKEAHEKYSEELKEISKLAEKAGFKEVSVTQEKKMIDASIENPDTIFFPESYLDHYHEATKYIKAVDINQGIFLKFLDLKNYFKDPKKREIFEKISTRMKRLEELENKIKKANKDEIREKTSERGKLQNEIGILDKLLKMDFRRKLSESEIEELSLRYNIMDILSSGIEKSFGVKAAELKKLRDEKKIPSDEEYNQRLSDEASPEIRDIHSKHPFLDEEIKQKLIERDFETAEKIGKTYLTKKQEAEEKEHGDEMMYR